MGKIDDRLAQMTDVLGIDLSDISTCLEQVEWAEDEIQKAMRRHPAEADTLWHSFKLIKPTHDIMSTEFVYRSHCRELLERVAAGVPTIGGTSAEAILVCAETSKLAPFTGPGAGLYFRLWAKAFPESEHVSVVDQEHYEALHGSHMDELERELRGKLIRSDRKLGPIECRGRHNGEEVQCKYVTKTAE